MQSGDSVALFQDTIVSHLISVGEPCSLPWFAVQTRCKYERVTSNLLQGKGFETYAPSYKAQKQWSDRMAEVEQALFPGYVFCRFDPKIRMPILTTPGVKSVVGFRGEPAAIDEREIDAVRAVIESGLGYEPCSYLSKGQRIRVIRGCMEGLEGILIRKKTEWRMVLSIDMLQRSVSVEVDREWIRAL